MADDSSPTWSSTTNERSIYFSCPEHDDSSNDYDDTTAIDIEGDELGDTCSGGSSEVWQMNSISGIDGDSKYSDSGYTEERGSNSIVSASLTEELSQASDDGNSIKELGAVPDVGNSLRSHKSWLKVKNSRDEVGTCPGSSSCEGRDDASSTAWRRRKKHFFILSHSGKPIYSRYGDEHKLAGFSATLQAIVSIVENGGDRLQLVRAGKHQLVFLLKGPLYLVCISCTEEPHESIRSQLELLYYQTILILTKAVNKCFEKNPKFDMAPLLGGTNAIFSSLISSFSWNPSTFLHAYACLPLPSATRLAIGVVLQDVTASGVVFAILMCKQKVVCLVSAQKTSLHPDDILLLSNFIMSSQSLRASESFLPICLPRYNPLAFLFAYLCYLEVDTYLVLLSSSSDSFYHLKDCRLRIETVLQRSNALTEIQRSMIDGGMHVEDLLSESFPRSVCGANPESRKFPSDLMQSSPETITARSGGPEGIYHFIYKSVYFDQYVASDFSLPVNTRSEQKRLYRAYQKIHSSMHRWKPPRKTQFKRDENFVLLCWVTSEFELLAAFDPLADKASAIKVCNRICEWVKAVENEIFLLGTNPFSW